MGYSKEDINEKALYVLRMDNNDKFYTDYLEIDQSLLSQIGLNEFYRVVYDEPEDKKLNNIDLYNYRKKAVLDFYESIDKNFHFLMGERSYCSEGAMISSYGEFKGIHSINDIKIYDYSPSPDKIMRMQDGLSVRMYTDDFIMSYLIEEAYKKCREMDDIKAYSHRRVGWTAYNYKLDDILTVDVSTNFGYGSACYFVITLVYNNIRIIPYSRLVLYYFANTMQLIRHTREYNVSDDSWKLAFDFVRDACNELKVSGERSFISKYVINECETLCDLLPKYLDTNVFNLSENRDGTYQYENDISFKTVKLTGYPLIVFRGEKVSGAVDFTDSIKELNSLFPTRKYLDCIHNCCVRAEPMITSALVDLENNISILRSKLDLQEKKCDEISARLKILDTIVDELDKIKETIKVKVYEENMNAEGVSSKYSPLIETLTMEKLIFEHPEYLKVRNRREAQKKEWKEQFEIRVNIVNEYNNLRNIKDTLSVYNTKILDYIKKTLI